MKKPFGKITLISVYDKTGLDSFARRLVKLGFKILSTGKTARFLTDAGVEAEDVSSYTGAPEILGGRVKTLHPKIHAGILARDSLEDRKTLQGLKIPAIDLVVVNLYPFEQIPSIENIDIGGPAMLRAAAKNHERVAVVCDPADYERVATALEADGGVSEALRRTLAGKVFQRMAAYDSAIAAFFQPSAESGPTPMRPLRYGENPHQQASFCVNSPEELLWGEPLQGKKLSYNNILDADAAWWLMREFGDAKGGTAAGRSFAAAIIKHSNPCGVALSDKSSVEALQKALACDPTSAFGGIAALNQAVDPICAEALASIFLEVILAPEFSPEAQKILAKKKNLRLLTARSGEGPLQMVRSAGGGLLLQESDRGVEPSLQWETKTKRQPTAAELCGLEFAWKVVKHVKSNAIVFAAEDRTLGIGAGQMSRVDSVKLAIQKAVECLKGSVVASDAFFPFADNIEVIAQAGATAIVQPGGSLRDAEVIAAADRHNLAMVFTGVRHFRH